MSIDEFYRIITEDKLFPKTSCPTISDYTDVFEPILKDGLDVLCFCISSLFSGSYQSAVNAAELMKEKYPERRVEIIDSVQATAGAGLIVYQSYQMMNEGYTLDGNSSVVERL